MIDLRSDTATRPTQEMRRAIAEAAVGDEQKREDPSVNELQERVAALLGQEAALFLPTATMANQIALKLLARPGDVLLAEQFSHVVIYEYGGAAAHAGLTTLGLEGDRGRVTSEQVRRASEPSAKVADQRATVLSLEDTHNSSGGRMWPLDELEDVVSTARELGLAVHLDGARLLNAAVAGGIAPAEISARFDTVTLCLSKGLGCPLGALLAGSRGAHGARVAREASLRRSDAAGGDRRRSRALCARPPRRSARGRPRARARARGGDWTRPAFPSSSSRSKRTSSRSTCSRSAWTAATRSTGSARSASGLSATIHPTILRAVTHLDVTDEDVERASELIPQALLAPVGASELADAEGGARDPAARVPEAELRAPGSDRADREIAVRARDPRAADGNPAPAREPL